MAPRSRRSRSSPDGRWVATGGQDGSVLVHEAATGERRHSLGGGRSAILALAWSPDSDRLAVSQEQGEIRIVEVSARTTHQSLALPGASTGAAVYGLAFSPDGDRLLGGDWSITTASVWDVGLSGGAEVRNVRGATGAHGVDFGTDARLFTVTDGAAVAVDDGGADEAVLRLAASGVGTTAEAGFRSLDVSADGSVVGIGNSTSGAVVWDADDGDVLFATPADAADRQFRSRTTFSPDGAHVAVAGVDRIEVLTRDGTRVAELSAEAGHGFRDPVFSPDGRLVAALGFPLDRGEPNPLPGDPFPLRARAGWDVMWWDWRADEVRQVAKDGYGHDPEFSPDGTRLAIPAVGGATQVLDVSSGRVVGTLDGHEGGVVGLDYSPDGRRIATGGLDGRTIIWDAETGIQLLQLPPSEHQVSSVAFSADGRHLATDSLLTDVVRVWTLDVTELRQIASDRLVRDLTAAECQHYLHRDCETGSR